LKCAKLKGLAGVAITDHNKFDGIFEASHLAKREGLLLVPGMEIATNKGDIIGLFLKEEVTKHNFRDAVRAIKRQGGLAVLPHPYKRTHKISSAMLDEIDLIEVFNARGERSSASDCNLKAQELAMNNGKAITAGSDAHFLREIGRGCVDVKTVLNMQELKHELETNQVRRIVYRQSSAHIEALSQIVKFYKLRDLNILKTLTLKSAHQLKEMLL
jgi:predicted metal-dependent phosphoesterase TrpH